MKAEELREKLHQYIDTLDEAGLREAYKVIEREDIMWQYSAEDIAKFYQRRATYINGEGRNYTMEESINSIRN
jgi:hypothetical protein